MTAESGLTPKAQAVLDAAGALFYARGIHAVGVDTIAERAGVTKKTLYDRFGSKESLVVAYLADRERRWALFLTERLDRAGDEPAARLAAVFDASAEWAAAHSGKGCAMINAHAEIDSPEHPAYAVVTGQKRSMLELFTGIAESAGVVDAPAVATTIMLLHEGALVMDGMHVVPGAYRHARDAALRLIGGL